MNIAAVMKALDVWDLDRTAKHALVVVACRAARDSGQAELAIRRVAADMKCHYNTARTALDRLVDTGYLTVDKSAGSPSTWRLNPDLYARRPLTASARGGSRVSLGEVACGARPPLQPGPRAKESLEKFKEESAAARARHPASGGAVDDPPPPVPPDPLLHNGSEPTRPDFAGARDRLVQLAAGKPTRKARKP